MSDLKEKRVPAWLYYYFVISLFLSAAPFYFWHMPTHYFTFLACFIFPLWSNKHISKYKLPILLFFLFYVVAFFNQYVELNIIGRIINILAPAFLFLIEGVHWKKIHVLFTKLYALAIIPSICVFILVAFIGIDLPSHPIDALNELKRFDYTAYPFLVMSDDPLSLFRFRGYFDEPGVIGTISGVLLVCNHFNLKRWENWPILISGILSFSLFFYLLVFLYLIIFGGKKSKITIVVLIVLLIGSISYLEDTLLYDLIINRLSIEDGEWVGNNRTISSFDAFYDKFVKSPEFWTGYGGGFSNTVVDEGGYSYKDIIVDYGIIMFLLYVFSMILYYIINSGFTKKALLCMMVFASIMFQRPMITAMIGIYLFLCSCYYNDSEKTEQISH